MVAGGLYMLQSSLSRPHIICQLEYGRTKELAEFIRALHDPERILVWWSVGVPYSPWPYSTLAWMGVENWSGIPAFRHSSQFSVSPVSPTGSSFLFVATVTVGTWMLYIPRRAEEIKRLACKEGMQWGCNGDGWAVCISKLWWQNGSWSRHGSRIPLASSFFSTRIVRCARSMP